MLSDHQRDFYFTGRGQPYGMSKRRWNLDSGGVNQKGNGPYLYHSLNIHLLQFISDIKTIWERFGCKNLKTAIGKIPLRPLSRKTHSKF